VRLSAWIKTQDVSGDVHLSVANVDGDPILGTTDWKHYEVKGVVGPGPNRIFLDAAVRLNGSGRVWIDDLKVEDMDKKGQSLP
jgi:hypothetical protein